jgi:hypothetical protein
MPGINIIIGDSQTPFIANRTQNVKMLSRKGSKGALWLGGMGLNWLKDALREHPTNTDVSNVVICIGTNGGFNPNENIQGLFTELRRAFPKAKFYAVQGSWGWGGNKNVTPARVKAYYDKFSDEGATIINPPIGSVSDPHGDLPVYSKIGKSIDSYITNKSDTPVQVISNNTSDFNGTQIITEPIKSINQTTQIDASGVISRPGDVYQYMIRNDHWLAKKPGQSRWFEISGADYKPQFQQSLDILDRENPDARSASAPNKNIPGGDIAKNQTILKGSITPVITPVIANKQNQVKVVNSGPVGNYGDLKEAQGKPLIMVLGGMPVGGRQSGGSRGYMYDYLNKGGIDYTLFVSKNHKIDGAGAYQAVKDQLAKDGIKSTKKILYLFSAGYYPGQMLLEKFGAEEFDKIYLVDIWIGNSGVSNFYKKIAEDNKDKTEYYYTIYGSSNKEAAEYIASKVKNKLSNDPKGQGSTHMATNIDAMQSINNYI